MSSEETLDMIEGRDSREAWLSQRYRVNDEVIIESLQRWHILSPKVGRLSSRKTAWQYSSFHGPAHCPISSSRTHVRQFVRHIGLLDEY